MGKEYTSHQKMMGDRLKHVRMNRELEDKYKEPLTFNKSVGFKVTDPRH